MLTSLFNFRTPQRTKRKWDSSEAVDDEEEEGFQVTDNLQTPPRKRVCKVQPQENTTPFGKVSTWFKETVKTTARSTTRLFRSFADKYNLWQAEEDNDDIPSPVHQQHTDMKPTNQEQSNYSNFEEGEERSCLYYTGRSPLECSISRLPYRPASYYSRRSIHDIELKRPRHYDPSKYDSTKTRDASTSHFWSISSPHDSGLQVNHQAFSQKNYPRREQSESTISSTNSQVYHHAFRNSPPVRMLDEVVRLAEKEKYKELLAHYTSLRQTTDEICSTESQATDQRKRNYSQPNIMQSRTKARPEQSLLGPAQSIERLRSCEHETPKAIRIQISPAKTSTKVVDVQNTNKNPFDCITTSRKPTTQTNMRSVDIFDDAWIKKWKETLSTENIEKERKIAKEKLKLESLRKEENEKFKQISEEVKARMEGRQPAGADEKIKSFVKLSSQMNCMVEKALGRGASNEVLAETSVGKITRADIATLGQQNWLNDEIVNTYFQLLADRSKKTGPKIHTFNTFFYSKLIKSGHASLRRWTKKVDLFKMEMVLIPIHLGMHWCLAVIDFKTKVISYYDSLKGENNQCLQALRDYLCAESLDKKKQTFDLTGWKCDTPKNIPEQMNGCDCGVFVCKYAEYISRRATFEFTQYHMPYFRRRMVYEILSKTLM